MFKKIRILCLILPVSLILVSCNLRTDKENKIEEKTKETTSVATKPSEKPSETTKSQLTELLNKKEIEIYNEEIKGYKELTYDTLKTKIMSKTPSLIYIGSKNCPYCRKFLRSIPQIQTKTGLKVDYISADNKDEELKKFIKQQEITSIPQLIFCKTGSTEKIELVYDKENNKYDLEKITQAIIKKGGEKVGNDK